MDVNVLGNVGKELCQNSPLALSPTKEIDVEKIVEEYMKNDLTSAIVFAGLEWLDQFLELLECIEAFRKKTNDDIIVYTGYDKDEIQEHIRTLKKYSNIIIKFGRYIPNQKKHYDKILRSIFSFEQSIWRENIMNVKEFKIGHYKLIINNKKSKETELKHPYSSSLYKNGKLLTKFRSSEPITEDNAFEFFLDKTLLKRTNQSLNLNEKN